MDKKIEVLLQGGKKVMSSDDAEILSLEMIDIEYHLHKVLDQVYPEDKIEKSDSMATSLAVSEIKAAITKARREVVKECLKARREGRE